MKILSRTFACMLASLLIGCSGGDSNISQGSSADPASGASQSTSTELSAVHLELLSIKDVPAQLAARKGKVVVLDMWATW